MPLFCGAKSFWVIQNNEPVINSINKLNRKGKAKRISAFDFSTLYTEISHDKVLSVDMLANFCLSPNIEQDGCQDYLRLPYLLIKRLKSAVEY